MPPIGMDESMAALVDTLVDTVSEHHPGESREFVRLVSESAQDRQVTCGGSGWDPETAEKASRRKHSGPVLDAEYRDAFLIKMHERPKYKWAPKEVHEALKQDRNHIARVATRRKGFRPVYAAIHLEANKHVQEALTAQNRKTGRYFVDAPYQILVPSVAAYKQELARVLRHFLGVTIAALRESSTEEHRRRFEQHMVDTLAGRRDPCAYPRPEAKIAMFTLKVSKESWPAIYEEILKSIRSVITSAEQNQSAGANRVEFGIGLAAHTTERK